MSEYSALDRALHRLAYFSPFFQRVLADLEDSLFSRDFEQIKIQRPVFITSLPRAGTTVLLTALNELPEFACHTYRDMPFVMSPLLWSKVSKGFRRRSELSERAHGDGVQVGFDSPEAFEEVLWKHFWPGKYGDKFIELWQSDDESWEATEFFRSHMAKIIALRSGQDNECRYLSKNNCNIGRVPILRRMFPDAKIVVPVRDPIEHAASLLRQHKNFLALHESDSFAKSYMRDIGHLEFGLLHRTIRFPGLGDLLSSGHPTSLDYWLQYWIATFEYVSMHRDDLIIVSLEQLRNNAAATIDQMFTAIEVANSALIEQVAGHFRSEGRDRDDIFHCSPELRNRAMALYETLHGGADE